MADLKISELTAATTLDASEFEIIQGGTNKRAANTLLYTPPTDDGAALGTTSLKWSDLFLASGGVVNFANGNFTLTHSSGILTAAGTFNATTLQQGGTALASLYQPLDDDLTSLAAASGTNTIYYRSAANTWSAVTIGSGLSFSTGTLSASASAKPVLLFLPSGNEPPSSNYATFSTRNLHPTLDFDTTTQESAIWTAVLPTSYAGGGLTVEVYFAAATATSGTIGWDVAIERIDASSLDLDADSFATAQTITAATVPGTSGQVLKSSVAITSGANMDSLAAGEAFRIRLRRDVTNDTATGDADFVAMVVRET